MLSCFAFCTVIVGLDLWLHIVFGTLVRVVYFGFVAHLVGLVVFEVLLN